MIRVDKIPAFTIIEISITLAIMGVISSMTYFIYISITQQSYFYSQSKITYFEYSQLNNLIQEDVFESKRINQLNENTIELVLDDFKTIKYKVNGNSLVRTFNSADEVFDVIVSSHDFTGASYHIPKIVLTYKLFNEDIRAVYYKNFGISNSINRNYLNEY